MRGCSLPSRLASTLHANNGKRRVFHIAWQYFTAGRAQGIAIDTDKGQRAQFSHDADPG